MAHPRDILISLQASPRKSFSQNFLTSPHWADRLTSVLLEAKEIDEIWEIGPGLGALTSRLLAKSPVPVVAFEIDRKLAQYLREQHPTLKVVEGDFLEANLPELLVGKKRVAVLSNLPYHISSPVLFRLLEHKDRFPRLVMTFQKEFANRLYAGPRTHDYSSLSVVTQLHYQVSSLGTLPPGAFYPPPAISSEAVLFEPKKVEASLAEQVSQVVKAAFRHRRKKVSSNLKSAFPKAPIDSFLESQNLSTNVRPEELSLDHYLRLARAVFTVLLLTLGLSSPASQDRNFGLGGETTGRVSAMTAEPETAFAALFNPGVLASQEATQLAFSTYASGVSYAPLGVVVSDSRKFRTETGEDRRDPVSLENSSSLLWSAGFTHPFRMPHFFSRKAGVGFVFSGPFEKVRTFRAMTPYDFRSLRYGNSDQQFKGTLSASLELWPETFYFGAGLSLFLSTTGAADAAITGDNPTGRLALDVGFNTAAIAGFYLRGEETSAGFVYRQEIQPKQKLTFDGKVQLGGQDVVEQPVLMQSTQYFEPGSLELDVQHRFPGLKVSAGLAWQQWSHYQPAFLVLTTKDADGTSHTTQVPALAVRDTVSPRVSLSVPLLRERLWVATGYQYRPSPLSDLSGPTNILDSNVHVAGVSASYSIPASENWFWPTTFSAYAQHHWLSRRRVDKADGAFVGSPGYDFSGTAYVAGVSLQADL